MKCDRIMKCDNKCQIYRCRNEHELLKRSEESLYGSCGWNWMEMNLEWSTDISSGNKVGIEQGSMEFLPMHYLVYRFVSRMEPICSWNWTSTRNESRDDHVMLFVPRGNAITTLSWHSVLSRIRRALDNNETGWNLAITNRDRLKSRDNDAQTIDSIFFYRFPFFSQKLAR